MNIIELNKNEVSNISGGFGIVDAFNLFGGTVVAGWVSSIIITGTPKIEGSGIGNFKYGLRFLKACLAVPYLIKTAIISSSLAGFGIAGGAIDEKIRGNSTATEAH